MTETEIMKGLECCISDGFSCNECHYEYTKHIINEEFEIMPNGKSYDDLSCDEWLKKDLFDLINRKNAELEAEKTYYAACLKKIEKAELRMEEKDKNLKFVRDTVERQKRAIEILSKNADTAFQDGLNEAQDLYREQIKSEVRAEAVKEFAERAKDVFTTIDGTFECWEVEEHIDQIAKEMGCGE